MQFRLASIVRSPGTRRSAGKRGFAVRGDREAPHGPLHLTAPPFAEGRAVPCDRQSILAGDHESAIDRAQLGDPPSVTLQHRYPLKRRDFQDANPRIPRRGDQLIGLGQHHARHSAVVYPRLGKDHPGVVQQSRTTVVVASGYPLAPHVHAVDPGPPQVG